MLVTDTTRKVAERVRGASTRCVEWELAGCSFLFWRMYRIENVAVYVAVAMSSAEGWVGSRVVDVVSWPQIPTKMYMRQIISE